MRRAYIPKGDGRRRPIGVPTFEDKVLQRAVTMVVSAIYEQDFLPCSYGFRPGRSGHDALRTVREGLMEMGGGYVVEIESYFDSIDPGLLRGFMDRRVTDGVLRRMIDKWLKAGVLEEGNLVHPDTGTPQGGVLSPLLANIFLHEVLDVWFEKEVRPRVRGRAYLVRYADDAVLAFEREDDAARVFAVLGRRFARFGLRLHPGKTRLVRFKRPRKGQDERPGGGGPGGAWSFDFLGFTHHWAKSLRGNWVIKQRTARDRFRRALRRITEWCRQHRHDPVPVQHEMLAAKLRGHYGYYGITGNQRALDRFLQGVERIWAKWLGRRSRAAPKSWEWFAGLKARWPLPAPFAVHGALNRSAKP